MPAGSRGRGCPCSGRGGACASAGQGSAASRSRRCFPGYLFVRAPRIDEDLFAALRSVPGFLRFLPSNDRIQSLSPGDQGAALPLPVLRRDPGQVPRRLRREQAHQGHLRPVEGAGGADHPRGQAQGTRPRAAGDVRGLLRDRLRLRVAGDGGSEGAARGRLKPFYRRGIRSDTQCDARRVSQHDLHHWCRLHRHHHRRRDRGQEGLRPGGGVPRR